jgi:hypothetical protein
MSIFLALCVVLSTSFVAPKSHAVTGLLVKKKVVKVIGGIGMAGGGVLTGMGLAIAGSNASGWAAVGAAIAAGVYLGYGIILGGIGLIILDDKQTVADVEFAKLAGTNAAGMDAYAVAVYNSELEELNAVRKTIQAELDPENSMEKARDLWNQYSGYLSPETKALAEAQATHFMKQM